MIGDNLNAEQLCALQALANICFEGQVASYPALVASVQNHRNTHELGDQNLPDDKLEERLRELYVDLAREGLVELRLYKGKDHVGLTQDGYRCNYIEVM